MLILNEVDSAILALTAPAPVLPLQMAAHAMTRPGGLHLVSIEASLEKGQPNCTPDTQWKFWHPRATGRGLKMPGVFGEQKGSDQRRVPDIPDEKLWEDFVAYNDEQRRWLIHPPEPTSWDSPIQCEFEGIPVNHVGYFQLAIAVGERSRFGFYLRFKDKWILYSDSVSQLDRNQDHPEYEIPAPELASSESVRIIVRDIQKDLSQTWNLEEIKPEVLDGIRFRGDFRLLFLRII